MRKSFDRHQLHTATIESLSHEGRGIAHIDQKIHFIDQALPGETVEFQLTRKHSRYNEGMAVNIINPAPERVSPRCEFYQLCGGCSLQHLSSPAQIELKQRVLLEMLKHIAKAQPQTLLPPLQCDTWGYRHKARLGAKYLLSKNTMLIGFRERNGRYLANMNSCEILEPRLGKRIHLLREFFDTFTAREHIAQLECAVSADTVALIIRHLRELTSEEINALTAFAKIHEFAIYLQPGKPDSIHKIYPDDDNELLSYRLDHFNLELFFHPTDFTQINPSLNPLMIEQALSLLDPKPDETILDLFCGLGNFTLPIATRAAKVIGVEGDPRMCVRATHNAAHNKLANTEFYAADLTQLHEKAPWFNENYAKILIDPPRSGAYEILEQFAQKPVQRIVYVSCNPATLARDAELLIHQQGYCLQAAGVMDMFAHTSHVEAMALFTKSPQPS
ncbi:MAG: 23S rRNA (uracil(1939)-C(5))-methyltransferase RlmD [Legionellales bacterium]|nr:23S rRNA (uracil(1939)-C(5))-methyltransferase RlmD [Legionellales bacterium]